MVEINIIKLLVLIGLLIVFALYYIYTIILFLIARLDRETAKRFKTICKIKKISPINCEKILIRKFVDDYTEEHKLEWK